MTQPFCRPGSQRSEAETARLRARRFPSAAVRAPKRFNGPAIHRLHFSGGDQIHGIISSSLPSAIYDDCSLALREWVQFQPRL
jgi:hypothetical protein